MQKDYYSLIREELINNEVNRKVKNYSINRNDLITYYNVGKMLFDAGKHYGEGIIKNYSIRLTKDIGKGYSKRNLWLMVRYYQLQEKVQTVSAQMTWSHYVELLPFNDLNKVRYYIDIVEKQNLSIRELRNRIKLKEYERLDESVKTKLINKEETNIIDLVKDPIIIKNINNYENISERVLQKLIMEDLNNFLLELGNSFCFVGNQYKIKIGNNYNYIDLLLFNIEYNCYVVIELKVTSLKKEHIGQIEVYTNYIDQNIKTITQNKTIGIIICKENNKFIIGYSTNPNIIAREYILV